MLWYVRWTMLGVLLWMLLITLPWASRRADELTLESTPASELEASDQNRQSEDQLAHWLFRDLAMMRGIPIDRHPCTGSVSQRWPTRATWPDPLLGVRADFTAIDRAESRDGDMFFCALPSSVTAPIGSLQ